LNRKTTVTRNVGEILRMYFSQDLAIKFTTVKAVPGKYVFRGTELYLCIQGIFTKQQGWKKIMIFKKNQKNWIFFI